MKSFGKIPVHEKCSENPHTCNHPSYYYCSYCTNKYIKDRTRLSPRQMECPIPECMGTPLHHPGQTFRNGLKLAAAQVLGSKALFPVGFGATIKGECWRHPLLDNHLDMDARGCARRGGGGHCQVLGILRRCPWSESNLCKE